jgi:enhancing lycopene biosynthesis protein 2
MVESARIARGEIKPLSQLDLDELDAVIFPGGFGAAKNLCTFAVDGPSCTVDNDVAATIKNAVAKGKVVGAICIAPTVVAKALEDTGKNPQLTIGLDKGTSEALSAMKARPVSKRVTEVAVDEANKIVTTPAYMLANRISEVADGIKNLVDQVMKMA